MTALPSLAERALPNSLWVVLLGIALLAGCSQQPAPTAASFVGKWRSSKLDTPIHLYNNGEWEIKKDDGAILQYGIWDYQDGRIVWNFKMGGQIGRDVNTVQSVTPTEFRLHEDRAITTFKRLD